MGGVLRGPSSGSPTPREEGVVWSHAPLWKPGSLSRAITSPQDPKPPQDPALLALEPSRGQVICGCPELASDIRPGGWSGGHGCREVGPAGSQSCLCPPPQENHKLRDQNDDLNGQILSLSLYEAKNLFATQTKAQSLAAEIDTASRDEVTCPHALAVEPGPSPVSPDPGQEKQGRA